MKYTKLALISIFCLSLLVLSISMLMPSKVVVSRAIDINAPADSVYKLLSNFAKWKLWLENYDTSKSSIIESGDGLQLKMNNTTVTIVDTSHRTLKTLWTAGNALPLPATLEVISHDSSSVTTVHWQFDQTIKWYPWEKFAAIFSEKTLGPFMDKSLDNLKQTAEHNSTSL